MDKKEFEFLLKQCEGLKLEFKEDFEFKNIKELLAFANTEGGRIFIGVGDTGVGGGIEITNKLKFELWDIARNCDQLMYIDFDSIDSTEKQCKTSHNAYFSNAWPCFTESGWDNKKNNFRPLNTHMNIQACITLQKLNTEVILCGIY